MARRLMPTYTDNTTVGVIATSQLRQIAMRNFFLLVTLLVAGCAEIQVHHSFGTNPVYDNVDVEYAYGLDGYNRLTNRPIPAGR